MTHGLVRALARLRHRLRGRHLRQAARFRARRPACTRRRCRPQVGGMLQPDDAAARARRARRHGNDAGAARAPGRDPGPGGVDFPVALAPGESWELRLDVVPSLTGELAEPPAVEARFGTERAHVRESLAAWHLRIPAAPRLLGAARANDRAVHRRPRRAAPARERNARPAPRGRHALVHDGVRPGHDHHVPADDALRPRARPQRAGGARRAAGRRRRPVDRRRAREDHSRAPGRTRRRDLVSGLLRHGRRDAPLPDPPLGDVALDRRRRRSRASSASRHSVRSAGSTATATATATASSSTSAAPRAASSTSRGRTPATRSASPTARSPSPPIAPAEVQGYVYDAKLRLAELARGRLGRRRARRPAGARSGRAPRALRRGVLARRTRRLLRARAGRATSVRVDSLCSNMGHLLWSGIVRDDRRRRRCRRRLLEPRAVVGLGHPDDVHRRRRLQPDSATTTGRSGRTTRRWPPGALRAPAGTRRRRIGRAGALRGGRVLRLVAARGVRRLRS